MNSIAFIDTEIHPKSRKILDIGSVKSDGSIFHKASVGDFIRFLNGMQFICGHNVFNHDIQYIRDALDSAGVNTANIIDTLVLSPLLFPTKPYHALLKDDKLQSEELNNPLNDSIKAKDLFYDEIAAFNQTDDTLKKIYYLLLSDKKEFSSFFRFIGYSSIDIDVEKLIRKRFENELCEYADLTRIISESPIELAYCLSLIHSFINHKLTHSITPPWVLKNYPDVERIMFFLRNKPCITGCVYCNSALDIYKGLKRFFGFDSFRIHGNQNFQEKAVKAAVDNKSLLAVFPTGGGKSITFQIPALMSGESVRGLTVVISPLQSLMKDQVDNLEKNGITEAVTINGLLDPIERAKSFERVEDGSASILYISPESLRSRTIERLILGRKIVRFVIDEAHCFSSWGQDFRVDYLYIGDFIKSIQEKKNIEDSIPVSCFTATAKQKVIEDISEYFREKLSLDLELFVSPTSRTNLHYRVYEKIDEKEKYLALRDLIEVKPCPTIIYVSRTKRAYQLAEKLKNDGFSAKPYHGKMDKKEKSENQDTFISGETRIMVATSAFGMGVDKKDVGMVIHYDISDSLENYIQEAGRAGRDENIDADCFVFFNEEDLGNHFILLNQTKLTIKEIQQIWKAIKDITKLRLTVSKSALEIARKAGWDDNVSDIETRVKTAIASLEAVGYLRRGQNMPRIFADSILSGNINEAIGKIQSSNRFDEKQKENGIRIIKKLFSSKSREQSVDESPESRVDYISDHLGIVKDEVINIVNLLREEKILADTKDLQAFIRKGGNKNRSLGILDSFITIEDSLLRNIEEQKEIYHFKELNEQAEKDGCNDVSISKIKTIINYWAIKNLVNRHYSSYSKNHIAIHCLYPEGVLREKMRLRYALSKFIVEFLYEKSRCECLDDDAGKEEVLVDFSVLELKSVYENSSELFKLKISVDDVEETLFYLSRIDAIKIEGGFLVTYNPLTIERLEQNSKKSYTKDDYQKLNQFYENKVQQIHIVGEYAKKMISNYNEALRFVDDYFQLKYLLFLRKYFPGSKSDDLRLKMTPAKFRQLFGELSLNQLKIINDNESKNIVVAAGPGSGKTRVLVHKLASLLLMEDVKHEQLLMLTFSRAAATEFKKRLIRLIGNAAHYVEIKTYHSFCFDLLGRVGDLENADVIIKKTIEKIKNNEVEVNRITKTVLVIDEAQDMDEDEFTLIITLMEKNEDMRVIAVGDDDQNIYEFRGSSSKYLEHFITVNKATKYELIENYRSKRNLVDYTNQFVSRIQHRLKSTPIIPKLLDTGTIRMIRYNSNNLIAPLVQDVLNTEQNGTTGILAKTNDEALQITGLLLKNSIPTKLIQANEGFNMYNLAEIRFFLSQLNMEADVFIISDDVWVNAKRELSHRFHTSSMLEMCKKVIRDFEETNPRKYKTDFEYYIRESRMENFFNENGDTVLVSTIHKTKGKEFDNVYLMLENFNTSTDSANRLLYVAMTRAKKNLIIHINSNILDNLSTKNMVQVVDRQNYLPPSEILIHLTYKDVWLDYFISKQCLVDEYVSGDELNLKGYECLNSRGQIVLKFSQQFLRKIERLEADNYVLKCAKVNFILYWLKEGSEKEIKIILPELCFEKQYHNAQ
ncbi:MAG: RecQ family ATP-dependent DNA helicase [Chlorobiaceae bacterium]|nr:RecQ family ATP-dependent DNA helicase [Chlorobiaceae bacterium]